MVMRVIIAFNSTKMSFILKVGTRGNEPQPPVTSSNHQVASSNYEVTSSNHQEVTTRKIKNYDQLTYIRH